jgi:hypothetical protein
MQPLILVFFIFLLTILSPPLKATEKKHSHDSISSLLGSPTATLLNINQISSWARNDGWNARDPFTGNAGLTFPRGIVGAIFQDGILWGGKVIDGRTPQLRVGGQTYSTGTLAGRILSRGVAESPFDTVVRIYRIRADFRTADLTQDAAELNRVSLNKVTPAMVASVRSQYEKDWNEWPWQQGAPFYDANSNGTRDAFEAPGVANADQVVWYVANDLNEARTLALYGSPPFGIEMQVTQWGYRATGVPWAQTILKRVKLIYKGTATTPDSARIDSMFVAQWSDPDLGDAGDDFAGCDTSLGLFYVYNADNQDMEYARYMMVPPAVGYVLVQSPTRPGTAQDSAIINLKYVHGKSNVPVHSMIAFWSTSFDPPFCNNYARCYFDAMKGLDFYTGRSFVHPRMPSHATRFWLDGDPLTGTGRVDGILSAAGDRRIMASWGPFSMALGDTQEVVIATTVGIGSSNIESVGMLQRNALHVRNDYVNLLEDLSANPDTLGRLLGPMRFFLHQSFPNPFNPLTTIRYEVGYKVHVTLRIVNILGQLVSTLLDGEKEAGEYEIRWNAAGYPSGVYFYVIEAGPYFRARKAIVLK